MENSYGIGVTNRYALFLEDESDPMETLKIKEQEKELKKKTKAAEKENKTKPEPAAQAKPKPAQPPVKKVIKDVPNKVQENKREDGKPNHQRPNDAKPERSSFPKFNSENREERNNRRNREDRPVNGSFENNRDREDRPRREGDFESRRGGRPVGGNKLTGGRGAPRRQFDDRRGKREFDRQSGSDKTHGYRGVKAIDKRDGGGAHNWGSNKDMIEEADPAKQQQQQENETWAESDKTDSPNTSGETKEPEPEVETAPVEEEPKELTLDEWKAQRAGRQKPTYNLRKAGEGEDLTQWKKMYELNKKKAGEEEVNTQDTDDEEYETSEYPQRVGRQKHVIGISFQFYEARRGGAGRGRGARTGGRGGGGGGGGASTAGAGTGGGTGGGPAPRVNRENREKPGPGNNRFARGDEQREDRIDARNAPKVDDERDFPSLG